MNKHHTIEEQHFELRFSNELDAFEQQETLEVFVKQRLLPIVDSVFDEVSGPEQLMRIDSITLDLGSVPYDDYEAETERRLREQLKNELLAYKLQIKEEPTSLVSSVSPQDSELELLEYFLNTGCLPWSGGSGADIDLERQLQDLLEKQPQALKTLLKAAGKREIGVRRLVKQFSIAQLELLLGLFAPKRSQAAINLYRDFRNLLQARDRFAIPEHQLNDLVWTELLTRAIQSGPSLAVNDSLLQHWLARLSELVEHSYSSLLGMLLETARKQVDRKEVSIEIRGILQRLDVTKVKDSTHRQPVSEQSATQTKLTHTEDLDDSKFTFTVNDYHHYLILKRRLIDATILHEADSARLTVGIKRLEQYAPWLLLRLAQELKMQPGFGLHNFDALVPEELEQLLKSMLVIFGIESGRGLEDFFGSTQSQAEYSPDKTVLYARILEQLIFKGGDIFDTFFDELKGHSRSHGSEAKKTVTLCYTDSSVSELSISDAELVQLLETYLHELSELSIKEVVDLSKLIEGRLRQPSSRLCVSLQDAMYHVASRNRLIDLLSKVALVKVLEVLAVRDHAELLRCAESTVSLFRVLDIGAISADIESLNWRFIFCYLFEDSKTFDKPVFIRALLVYLAEQTGIGLSALTKALTETLTQAIKSGLGTAVSDNLVQVLLAGTVTPATDKTLLYSRVLERFIIQNRDGFDAFANKLQGDSRSRGNDGEDKVTLEHANETSHKTPADLRNQSEYLACLEQYLNQAKSLKNISSEELVQALKVMIEQRSESLKSLLHSALVAHRPVSHLVALLPERLLPQVLSLLKVDSGAQALQCADSIVLACRNMELAPDYAELQTLRWCFVFEYFCVQGRAFSASEFIWRFVEALRRQMDFSDEQSFYAGLMRQVGSSLSASTSDVQLTVLAAMVAERSDIEAIESEAEVRAELKAGARAEVKPVVEVGPEAKAGVEAESEGRAQTRIREEAEIRRAASSLSKNRLSEAEFMRSLEAYLNKTAELCAKDWVDLSKSIEIHLQRPSSRLLQLLRKALRTVESRNRLIDLFPEMALVRLLAVLGVRDHPELLRCAESTVNLFRALDVGAIAAEFDGLKWQFIACYLFEEDRTFEKQAFIRDLIIYLSEQNGVQISALVQALKLRSDLDNLPEMRRLRQPLLDALTRSESKPNMPPAMKNHSTLGRSNEEELEVSENVYIHNAGLVLVAPYIPRLLEMLNLTADSEFKSRSAAERGIHLLQYLVNGSCSSPEYQLVLNKILCGVTTGTPIVREIAMDDNEATVVVSLLQSIIEHWTAIGSTSIAGLQESFLQREGRLRLKNDSWHLLVEARAFDMLLDRLPWSFSLIKFPWMQRPIHVEWR